MKTVILLFIFGALVAVSSGLPASKKDEVESVRPITTYGDQPIVDTGLFGSWENPFSSNPFIGMFDNLEDIMASMRQKIASLLNTFPSTRGGNSTDEDLSPFPGFGQPPFPGIGGIDLSKGNTTSVTKVIDGHKVVINETEYKDENDFGGTFFKVRIIDVKPDSSELTTEKESESVTATPKDREELGNSIENEISKSKEALQVTDYQDKVSIFYDNLEQSSNRFEHIETFEDEVTTTSNRFSTTNDEDIDAEWGKVEPFGTFESTNELDAGEMTKNKPIDLSRDTYVNELVGAPNNPDAEIFEVENIRKIEPR